MILKLGTTSLRIALIASICGAGISLAAGCGSNETQNKDFYTSGNREADQRADQRMAQAEQLKGEGQDNGETTTAGKKELDKRSLYDRLGGAQAMLSISDDFVTRAMADPRVNWNRKDVVQGGLSIHHDKSMEWDANPENVKVMKAHLAQFLSVATGGPPQYQGKQMKEAHADMHITNDEFDASVGDLKATLDKMQIPNAEQKELLAIVESTRAEIVEDR